MVKSPQKNKNEAGTRGVVHSILELGNSLWGLVAQKKGGAAHWELVWYFWRPKEVEQEFFGDQHFEFEFWNHCHFKRQQCFFFKLFLFCLRPLRLVWCLSCLYHSKWLDLHCFDVLNSRMSHQQKRDLVLRAFCWLLGERLPVPKLTSRINWNDSHWRIACKLMYIVTYSDNIRWIVYDHVYVYVMLYIDVRITDMSYCN